MGAVCGWQWANSLGGLRVVHVHLVRGRAGGLDHADQGGRLAAARHTPLYTLGRHTARRWRMWSAMSSSRANLFTCVSRYSRSRTCANSSFMLTAHDRWHHAPLPKHAMRSPRLIFWLHAGRLQRVDFLAWMMARKLGWVSAQGRPRRVSTETGARGRNAGLPEGTGRSGAYRHRESGGAGLRTGCTRRGRSYVARGWAKPRTDDGFCRGGRSQAPAGWDMYMRFSGGTV